MSETEHWFNMKDCKRCSRPLPSKYPDDLCPICKDLALFDEVREYIRSKDVSEYDVADHFGITVEKVKSWIHDGRIEYKEIKTETIHGLFCEQCGAPVAFGALCGKCLKQMNETRKGISIKKKEEKGRIRFLDEE